MRWLSFVTAAAVLAACNFGDNRAVQPFGTPDAGGTGQLDAAVHGAHDAAVEPDAHAPADAEPPPPACALVPQDGCAGTTPACDLSPADDGTVACRAVTKNGVSNSHCALATDCRAGYTCTNDGDSSDAPWCSRFCAHDADCVGTGSRCIDDVTDGTVAVPICTHACDPYAQTGCPSGMGCVATTDAGGDYSDCAYMGTVADGDACTHATDCELGATCVMTGGTSVCLAYCLVGDDSTCDAGACMGFTTPLVLGGVEFGVCN